MLCPGVSERGILRATSGDGEPVSAFGLSPRAWMALSAAVGIGWLPRELMLAMVSVVILWIALWILMRTFADSRIVPERDVEKVRLKVEAFGRQKDVLLLMLRFLGTVTRYYLYG